MRNRDSSSRCLVRQPLQASQFRLHRFDEWPECLLREIEFQARGGPELGQRPAPTQREGFTILSQCLLPVPARVLPELQCADLGDAVLDVVKRHAEQMELTLPQRFAGDLVAGPVVDASVQRPSTRATPACGRVEHVERCRLQPRAASRTAGSVGSRRAWRVDSRVRPHSPSQATALNDQGCRSAQPFRLTGVDPVLERIDRRDPGEEPDDILHLLAFRPGQIVAL